LPKVEIGAVAAADDRRTYFAGEDDAVSLMAVDVADGHVVWDATLSHDDLRTNGTDFALTTGGLLAFWEHEDGIALGAA